MPGTLAMIGAGPGGIAVASGGGPTWQTTWSQSITTQYDGGEFKGATFRSVIAAADLSLSGTTIRVSFKADVGDTIFVDHASIVERSSGYDGTTTPTELLFSGVSGFVTGVGLTVVSDSLSFTLDETKDYLVIVDSNALTSGMSYNTTNGDSAYKQSAASYNSQNLTSPTSSGNARAYGVTKIEVFA